MQEWHGSHGEHWGTWPKAALGNYNRHTLDTNQV